MLQPLFHIEANNIEAEDFRLCRLLIVVDAGSVSYVILNIEDRQPRCIKYFHFSQLKGRLQEEIMREIIFGDELLAKEFNKTYVAYNFPDSTLVPDVYFAEELNNKFADLIYGNLDKGSVASEKVPLWEMYNVYRLPLEMHTLMQYKFPAAKQWHYYSLLLKSYKKFNTSEQPECFQVIFLEERMIVSAYKKGQLQLMQSFLYSSPKDVLYHLLNCCRQLAISQQEASLQISGLIEKQSLVYNELIKYFLNVTFEELGDSISKTDWLEQCPLHYFSSILKMAACV